MNEKGVFDMAEEKKMTGSINPEDLFPQAKVPEGVEDDPHGPLMEFRYNLAPTA